MTEAQRADYQRTGDLPAAVKPTFTDDPPASSAAPQAEPAAATAAPAQADSDPADTDPDYKPKTKARIAALLTETKRLKDELAKRATAPPAQTLPAASSPAPVEIGPKPDGTDYTKYPQGTSDPQYLEDLAGWKALSIRADERKADTERTTKERAAAETARIRTEWGQKVDAIKATHPDAMEKFQQPIAIAPGSAADLWILESAMGPETLYHLYDHPEEVARITALSPLQQIEAMVVLGLSVKGAAPTVKTKTDAPAPAPRLDTRPSSGADDAEAAMTRGDFAAYTRIMNDRETAGLRSRK